MTLSRFHPIVLAIVFGTLGCETSDSTSGVHNVLREESTGVIVASTASEALQNHTPDIPGVAAGRPPIRVDSVQSRAPADLWFYWVRVPGKYTHDFRVVTVIRYGDDFFDPAAQNAWNQVVSEWVPANVNEALEFCAEVVATAIDNAPNRLVNRDFLFLDSALNSLSPQGVRSASRAMKGTLVHPPSKNAMYWDVSFWYPNLDPPARGRRLATRYKCEVPARAGGTLRIVESDSILLDG